MQLFIYGQHVKRHGSQVHVPKTTTNDERRNKAAMLQLISRPSHAGLALILEIHVIYPLISRDHIVSSDLKLHFFEADRCPCR